METQGSQEERLNALSRKIFFAGLEVHRHLGPGMLEGAYKHCLVHECGLVGLRCEIEVPLAINYKGLEVPNAYKIDVLVESCFPVELKSVEEIHPRHRAQLLTYLKYGDFRLGLLMNFNVLQFKDGVIRVVNGL